MENYTCDNEENKFDDEFDLKKYPYLFKIPINRHPPGIERVGPQVYKESTDEL